MEFGAGLFCCHDSYQLGHQRELKIPGDGSKSVMPKELFFLDSSFYSFSLLHFRRDLWYIEMNDEKGCVANVAISLGIIAGIIFVMYSVYFTRIIRGNPQQFEKQLLTSLADWLVQKGAASKRQAWMMLFISAALEIAYFLLVFLVITNPVMLLLTTMLVGLELYHLIRVSWGFYRFFAGKAVLGDIFNWYIERMSAVLFFTHTLFVIIILLFF